MEDICIRVCKKNVPSSFGLRDGEAFVLLVRINMHAKPSRSLERIIQKPSLTRYSSAALRYSGLSLFSLSLSTRCRRKQCTRPCLDRMNGRREYGPQRVSIPRPRITNYDFVSCHAHFKFSSELRKTSQAAYF